MHRFNGFTLIETLLSIVITSTLVWSVLTVFVTSRSASVTSEGYLYAGQQARKALDAITQDLAGAQIYSYYVNQGAGKVYVKFRRLDPALVQANGDPFWQARPNMRMYAWCSADARPLNPCAQILPALVAGDERKLLLVCAGTSSACTGAGNANAEINLPWTVERVIANNLDTDAFVPNNPLTLPFNLDIRRADNVNLPQVSPGCGANSPDGVSEGCVNRRANPAATFGFAFSGIGPDILPAYVDVTIRTRFRERQTGGRTVPAVMRGRVKLRNPQSVAAAGP